MKRASVIAAVVILGGVSLLIGGVALVMGRPKPDAGQAASFEPVEAAEIVAAREVSWQPTADLVGTVIAMRSVMVRNELAGVVRFVGFQSGEAVEAGQVLLKQDDATDRADLEAMKAAVRVAEANIAQSDSQIGLAEAELRRLTEVESRAVAEVDRDRARTKLESARADRGRWAAEADQARARVAQSEARLEKLTLKAPFRARIGLRTVHEGQYLAAGTDVAALQELADTIYLDFAVPQEYAPRVQPGTSVMATGELLGPDPVKITVSAVDSTVNNDTRNLRIRAIVNNPRGILVPGMSIRVRVPTDEPRMLVAVPSTAVRRAAYGNSVFVITTDAATHAMQAHQRFVTLGQAIGEEVVVLDGLKAGESIAAAGSFKLRDGIKVMSKPPAAPPAGEKPAEGAGASGANKG